MGRFRPYWQRPGYVHLAVLLCYGLLTVVMTWPLILHWTKAIPGDGFDGWQNFWNLWWMRLALVDRVQNPYFTDLLYFPTGVELYFHTLNPFNGLFTLPIQLAAVQVASGLFAAYNVVVLFSWVAGGYGMFLLALRVWRKETTTMAPAPRYGAALIAGAIFTFAPLHMAHLLGHMQVMSLEWIPFYCLYLLRGLDQRAAGRAWIRDALLAGGFLVLTGLCDWYFVLYLFFFTALALVWRLVRDLRSAKDGLRMGVRIGLWWRPIGVALVSGALFLLLLGPILLPMLERASNHSFMVRPTEDLFVLSASVADFLVPNRLHTFFRPNSFGWIGNQIAPVSERTISIGYIALAMALVALWRQSRRAGFWMAGVLLFGALALGPIWRLGNITWENVPSSITLDGYWTPFALFNRLIPFMRISRSVSRYALMVQLSIAVLAAGGLYAFIEASPRFAKRAGLLMTGLLVLLLGEYWVAPYPISAPDTPAYYSTLAGQQGGALLNLPMNYDRPGYLLYQTVHRRPLSVAYISRDDPRTLVERVPVLQHFRHLGPDILMVDLASVGQSVLADLGIEIVVLDRYKMPGGVERVVTTEVAQQIFQKYAPEYEDERLTVYAVGKPESPAPYPMLGADNWGPLMLIDGAPSRHVGQQAADIILRRAPQDGFLRIRYRMAAGVRGELLDGETGEPLMVLPESSEREEIFVALSKVVVQKVDDIATQVVSLRGSDEGELTVVQVEIVGQLPLD